MVDVIVKKRKAERERAHTKKYDIRLRDKDSSAQYGRTGAVMKKGREEDHDREEPRFKPPKSQPTERRQPPRN